MAGMTYESSKEEPTLEELFGDPIVKMLMDKDGVLQTDLSPLLDQIAQRVEQLDTAA